MILCNVERINKYFTVEKQYKEYIKHNFKDITIIEDKQGIKDFLLPSFNRYRAGVPSVTQVLALMPYTPAEYFLIKWFCTVDIEKYEATQKSNAEIMNRGTLLHKCLEDYYTTGKFETEDTEVSNLVTKYINTEKDIELIASEQFIEGKAVCGTIDLIAKKKGINSIIDFKTTTKTFSSFKQKDIDKYAIQISIYNTLVKNNLNLNIEEFYICQFSFPEKDYRVIQLDAKEIENSSKAYIGVLSWLNSILN